MCFAGLCGTALDRRKLRMQGACDYTHSQQKDMLHLRRLFYGKLGQLSRERSAILSRQPEADSSQPFSLDFKQTAARDARALEFTNQLCVNRAEESRTYIFSGMCMYCVSRFSICSSFTTALSSSSISSLLQTLLFVACSIEIFLLHALHMVSVHHSCPSPCSFFVLLRLPLAVQAMGMSCHAAVDSITSHELITIVVAGTPLYEQALQSCLFPHILLTC